MMSKSNLTFCGIKNSISTSSSKFDAIKSIITKGKCQSIDLRSKKLTEICGMPREILGNFKIGKNDLKNLIGSPEKVDGDFECPDNNLKTLFGISKYIGGNFWCYKNYELNDISDIWFSDISNFAILTINNMMAMLPLVKFNFAGYSTGFDRWEQVDKIDRIISRNRGSSKQNIINCQYELIENGFENHARWKPLDGIVISQY